MRDFKNPVQFFTKTHNKTSHFAIVFGTLFAPGGFAVRDEYF